MNKKLRAADNSSRHLENEKLEREMRAKLETLSLKGHRTQTVCDYEIMQAKSDVARQESARRLIKSNPRKMSLLVKGQSKADNSSVDQRPHTVGPTTVSTNGKSSSSLKSQNISSKRETTIYEDEDMDDFNETVRHSPVKRFSDGESDDDDTLTKSHVRGSAVARPHTAGPASLHNPLTLAGSVGQQKRLVKSAVLGGGLPLSTGGEQAHKRVRSILRARTSTHGKSRRQIRAQLEAELDARRKKKKVPTATLR